MSDIKSVRLTKPLLEAMAVALDAALSGEGFNGGDFDGMNERDFERAREWVLQQQTKRQGKSDNERY